MHRYFLLNKPRNMVSQFVSSHAVPLLCDLAFTFPEGTHAIGRLDRDSEGLLILTTDKSVTRKLFLSAQPHLRSYFVLVQDTVSEETVERLRKGISLTVKNNEKFLAMPQAVELIAEPKALCPQAFDDREKYPHSWLLITLAEGKYHQVRKMVKAVRHRCLRLVRLSIGGLQLNELAPGEVRELPAEKFFETLFGQRTYL